MTRINKFLAEYANVSRREADRLIQEGRVTVNGADAVPGMDVSLTDAVRVDGKKRIQTQAPRLVTIALNKPVGYITTTDRRKKDTVLDLITLSDRLFPIGRLDVESSGLLLLTTNGDLAHRLMHPSYEHEKEYRVQVDRPLTREAMTALREGIFLDNRKTLPAFVRSLGKRSFLIRLKEGRNRQIRRMCEALGYTVSRLKRERIGEIRLGDLKEGRWRYLSDPEQKWLQSICKEG